jgi:hypothetical protein
MHVVGNNTQNAFIEGLFWARNNRWLVPALVVASWWGIRQRSMQIVQLLLWMIVVILLANPVLLGLPYISFFTERNRNYGDVCANGVDDCVVVRLGDGAGPRWQIVVVLAMTVLAFMSANDLQHVVNDETIIATADDLNAMQWIATNLPQNAVILTNASGWMWRIDRGSDGGWWALPLTGRQVTTPPVLYTYGTDEWVRHISQQTGRIRDADGSSAGIAGCFARPSRNYDYLCHESWHRCQKRCIA